MTNSFALNWVFTTLVTFGIFNLFGWGVVLAIWFVTWNIWDINWTTTWFLERAAFLMSILFGMIAAGADDF